MAVAQAEGTEEESGPSQQIRPRQPERNFLSERVQPRMVYRHPGCILAGGSVHDPVDQIVAPVVIGRGRGPDAPAEEFHAAFQGAEFLGLQVGIRQVSAHRIVQFRKSGHAVGRVVGGIEPHGVGNPEVGVNAREQADSFLVAGIVNRRKSCRGGQPAQDDMMLQEQVESRPVQAADIDAPGIGSFLAEVRADDPFVPGLGTEGRLSQPRIGPEVQVRAQDIGLVVIERIFFRSAAEQFEAVLSMVPVQGRGEMQGAFPFRLDGSEGLQRVLELVVEFGAVEGAGSEILVAHARLPAEVTPSEVMGAVPEGLDGTEVAVQAAGGVPAVAVAALVSGGNAVEAAPVPDFC